MIFKRRHAGNTMTACWFEGAGFVAYYSIYGLFATHLQKISALSPALIATPIAFANILVFLASSGLGLGVGPASAGAGRCRSGEHFARDPAGSELPVLRQLYLGGNRLRRCKGCSRAAACMDRSRALLDRAVPHRNPRHRDRLLLSRRRHPRRDWCRRS